MPGSMVAVVVVVVLVVVAIVIIIALLVYRHKSIDRAPIREFFFQLLYRILSGGLEVLVVI